MGKGNTRVGGAAGGCSDAGDHLEGHTLFCKGIDFLAAPAKDEWVAAFKAHHPLALFGQFRQQFIDLFLAHGMFVAFLAYIDTFCIAPYHLEYGFGHQSIIYHHVGLLHQAQCPKSEQIGISGAAAHQIDLTHAGRR